MESPLLVNEVFCAALQAHSPHPARLHQAHWEFIPGLEQVLREKDQGGFFGSPNFPGARNGLELFKQGLPHLTSHALQIW